MESSKNNIISVEILESDYLLIDKEVRDRMNIKIIEPKDFDYTFDDKWNGLKKESTKAYKELKKREFELRHEKHN